MDIVELLLLAVGLSCDAFAVSISKGVTTKETYLKTGLVCGLWFGLFQALMPLIGWAIGFLAIKIPTIDHFVKNFSSYIAFFLLVFLGVKMIVEAIKELNEEKKETELERTEEKVKDASLAFKTMFVFALATSIDALAAGLTFTATGFLATTVDLKFNIFFAISLIGATTFLFSFVGSIIGAKIGEKFKTKATIFGGLILIAIGLKILLNF